MTDEVITSDKPFDRLTELSVEMAAPLQDPEYADVKAILFLTDAKRSGIQIYGYEETSEALADLFIHMKAMFKSMGKDLDFIGIPESPADLD